jgi:hypothetical protein
MTVATKRSSGGVRKRNAALVLAFKGMREHFMREDDIAFHRVLQPYVKVVVGRIESHTELHPDYDPTKYLELESMADLVNDVSSLTHFLVLSLYPMLILTHYLLFMITSYASPFTCVTMIVYLKIILTLSLYPMFILR